MKSSIKGLIFSAAKAAMDSTHVLNRTVWVGYIDTEKRSLTTAYVGHGLFV